MHGARRSRTPWMEILVALLLVGLIQAGCASTPVEETQSATEHSVEEGVEEGASGESTASNGSSRLEPRYQPREPVPDPWYNSSYIFGMTRGVANSTMAPAGKAPLFVLTVPLDFAFLPFTLIGGLFG
jgi:hypothetical protein